MKEHLFDKRVVQRALQEGLIDPNAYQRMLDALPDLSHKLQTAEDLEDSAATRSSGTGNAELSAASSGFSPEL